MKNISATVTLQEIDKAVVDSHCCCDYYSVTLFLAIAVVVFAAVKYC